MANWCGINNTLSKTLHWWMCSNTGGRMGIGAHRIRGHRRHVSGGQQRAAPFPQL